MQRIVPSIWFDHTAAEAAEFYTSIFPEGRVIHTSRYPSSGLLDFQESYAGLPLAVEFELAGHRFIGINAGAEFRPNPSVSFMLNFDPSVDPQAREHLDQLWAALSEGGQELMPLQEYPFSQHYGWMQDKYGVSWQLMLTNPEGDPRPFIIPALMFAKEAQGKARPAMERYQEIFAGTPGALVPYGPEMGEVAGEVMFADFQLAGQWFIAMDSAGHGFTFDCGVSLVVLCEDQAELDQIWTALSAVPEAEQCGWCVDEFGLSWQVVSKDLFELMARPGNYAKVMGMKKLQLSELS